MTLTRHGFRPPRFERRLRVFIAALFSLAALLVPAQLFKAGNAHFVEHGDTEGRRSGELLKIYSVVRRGMSEVDDGAVWSVARTILQESRRHALDPLLVLAIINVESGFRHKAEAADGTRGLMQIQPDVARAIAEERKAAYRGDKHASGSDLDDPVVNIKLGVYYLHSLRRSFQDLRLALTAYNRGPTRVKNEMEEDVEVPQEYASKVLATYHGYRKEVRRFD